MKGVVVISVGGSIIVPDDVDFSFLKQLRVALKRIVAKHKVVICTGGGHTARRYIDALRKLRKPDLSQSFVGIASTRLNALLLALSLDNCNHEVPRSLGEVKSMLRKHDVVVCGGLKPGRTSDGTTAEIAQYLGSKVMVNMTNVKGLYSKDPRKHKDAEFIPCLSHADFAKMMGRVKERPGQHFVLDSVAAKIARKEKMEVIILKGVRDLELYLSGKKFAGTVIF